MHGSVVTRKCTRLGERRSAKFALEGPHIDVSPVVDDETGAFDEYAVAVVILADEVCLGAATLSVRDHFDLFVRAGGHRL